METSTLETAVIRKMLDDPQFASSRRFLDLSGLVITEKNINEVGFITNFARTEAAKLFSEDISARWGKVVGLLNSKIDVDFVVFVDDGYLTGIEGCTFGGEVWPSEIEHFELVDLPNQ